jgi:hypothetical protein
LPKLQPDGRESGNEVDARAVAALHEKFKLKPNFADMDKGIMAIPGFEGANQKE